MVLNKLVFGFIVLIPLLFSYCLDLDYTLEVGPSIFDLQCISGSLEFCDCANTDADPRVLEVCEENDL